MAEHLNPVVLQRRRDDPLDANFHSHRKFEEREVILEKPDTLTKWIVGVVASAIIATLAVLAVRDRESVDKAIVVLTDKDEQHAQILAQHETTIQLIRQRQERVLIDLGDIKKQLDSNSEKLDRMLIEIRRK